MSSAIRTIGVCNGGGDCPGLNAVICAVVRTAKLEYGWSVIGVTNGSNRLIWPEQSDELTLESFRGILPARRFWEPPIAEIRSNFPSKRTSRP